MDDDRALDVGALRRGTGTFKVRNPKVPEGGSDVTVGENPDELTFKGGRSEYLEGTDRTGMPSARRCTRASKEKVGKKCMTPTR